MKANFQPNMITEEMKTAASTVVLARVFADTIRPVVRGYQQEILDKEKYSVKEEFQERRGVSFKEWIETPEQSYLMDDDDFQHYLKRSREEQAKAGLKTESPDHCPLLVADHLTIQAEKVLIDVMEPVTGLTYDTLMCSKDCLENRDKFLELTLRLLVPYCDLKIA